MDDPHVEGADLHPSTYSYRLERTRDLHTLVHRTATEWHQNALGTPCFLAVVSSTCIGGFIFGEFDLH